MGGGGVNISEDARHWTGLLQYNPSTGEVVVFALSPPRRFLLKYMTSVQEQSRGGLDMMGAGGRTTVQRQGSHYRTNPGHGVFLFVLVFATLELYSAVLEL